MEDVAGLADKSNDFANFLKVRQKFGYICLYIFHIIYPTKSIWQIILPQTKISNIFLPTIQLGNILKILTNNCDRKTISYIRDLWINRLYLSLSNESKYSAWPLTAENQALQSIGMMQIATLNNFFIMDKVKRIGFLIFFWLRRSIKMKIC